MNNAQKNLIDLEHRLHINDLLNAANETRIKTIKKQLEVQEEVKEKIKACIELLNVDGRNTKKQVKNELNAILEVLK